jgi:YfiR/HmsC-like
MSPGPAPAASWARAKRGNPTTSKIDLSPSQRAIVALALWLLSPVCGGPPAHAQDGGGSVEVKRALILARALAYDTRLAARAGNQVVLAIVYRKGDSASEVQASEMSRAFRQVESLQIVGLPFRAIATPYTGPNGLEALIDRDEVDAFLLCEGLAAEIPAVRQLGRSRKVITAGNSEEQVRAGLSLAVVNESSRLHLMVNLAESRQQGSQFDSALLRIARVVK